MDMYNRKIQMYKKGTFFTFNLFLQIKWFKYIYQIFSIH